MNQAEEKIIAHTFELSIINCFTLINNLRDRKLLQQNYYEAYRNKLFKIQEARYFKKNKYEFFVDVLNWPLERFYDIAPLNEEKLNEIWEKELREGRIHLYCNEVFFSKVLGWSTEDIENIDFDDIPYLNELVGSYKCSFVNYDSRIVQFSDEHIIDSKTHKSLYFEFLSLLLFNIRLPFINEVLTYHVKKHPNKDNFISNLLDYYDDIGEFLNNPMIRERIIRWNETENLLPPLPTKTERWKEILSKFGFFQLPMVKELGFDSQQRLVEVISSNDLPYGIAMIDFLGFIDYLEKEHFKLKTELHKRISSWFNSDKEGRAVRGNCSVLYKNSNESDKRYTAHLHIQKVKEDYHKLK